ncbi:MAG: TniQ family protein [Anaerolineae bacterium]|nr:TniQ family protein [Anaerolineae bacterium]
MADELMSYPTWKLALPQLPPRSRLYHLCPLGLGTPLVESLTSYLVRLAQAHCVSVGQLLRHEIAPASDELTFQSGSLSSWFKSFYTINGLDHFARNFARTLQRLTLHSQLQYLTMLTWAQVLPTKRLLRPSRAWCPACYQSWSETGQPLYDPLLFSLRVVTICPVHHQHLVSQCPYLDCQRPVPFLAARIQPGFCPCCNRSLALFPSELQAPTQDELLWQKWVGLTVGQLLSAAPTLSTPPSKDRIATTLSAYATQLTGGTTKYLAHKLDLPARTLQCWRRGTRLPHLTSLLQLSYRLGTSPLDFLTQDPLVINPTPFTFLQDNPFLQASRRNIALLKPHQVRTALETALTSEEPPPSFTQMVRRLGYQYPSLLRRQFPELCRAISARYRFYQQGTGSKTSPGPEP